MALTRPWTDRPSTAGRRRSAVDPRAELPIAVPLDGADRAVRATGASRGCSLLSFAMTLVVALPDGLVALWLKLFTDGIVDGAPHADPRRRARARRVGRADVVPDDPLSTGSTGGSATASASPSRPASPSWRRRSRRSSCTSGPSTSTACRSCAIRCSPSTTCSCRCSSRSAGCSGSSSPACSWPPIHPALLLLLVFARPDGASPRRGARRWSERSRSRSRCTSDGSTTSSPSPPPPRRARRCASPAPAPTSSSAGTRRGSGGTDPIAAARGGRPRCGRARRGRCSASPSSARSCSSCPASTRAPDRSCWSLVAGGRLSGVRRRGGRRARLPARHLDGLGAAARLARGLRRLVRHASRRAGAGSARRRDPLRARDVPLPGHRRRRCSTTSTSTCPRARWWRSSARTAPASPPSSSC